MIFTVMSPTQWKKLKKILDKGFSEPTLVLFILLVLVILSWKIFPKKWHRHINIFMSVFGFAYLILYSPVGAFLMVQGLVGPLPQSSEVSADTIVMLGRGGGWADEQVETATQLWESNRNSQIFISGNSIETEILSERLLKEGIPPEQISGEHCSQSTEDNARFTKAILADKQIHQIMLVTDEPHMLRSLLTFQSFGFQVSPHPVELPDEMKDFTVSKIALREYLALISYASLGRFQQRSSIELQNFTECMFTLEVNNQIHQNETGS